MQKITPCLWFDTEAEEAANLYVSLFKNSKITETTKYPEAAEEVSGKKAGTVLTVAFELDGVPFMALNGGPEFPHSEAISFVVDCADQEEVDHFWNGFLADGGEESQCGWLKDKFGVSWQITPKQLKELLSDPDPVKANRVMAAMLEMKKIDIAKLQEAYDSE